MLEAVVGFLAEILLDLFGELLFTILVPVLAEIVAHGFLRPMQWLEAQVPRAPALPWLGMGLVAGLASLSLFPIAVFRTPDLRLVNLLLAPTIAGLVLDRMGKWRLEKGQPTLRLDGFTGGFLFALGAAAVRLIWAT
ncbi:MAG: hypothetical protein GX442_15730 [Candidatus Riflebacteria bacterium]|nr:hypothetical protein [Candidatus Riflebacteria bacterium]